MKYLIMLLLLLSWHASACTFTMGYRLSERLPLINAAPNNDGLYKELYSTALEKINCKLKIIREPKRRILKKIGSGKIDFYPGFTFSKERAKYAYFFENGLEMSFLAISSLSQPTISRIEQLRSKIILIAQGGPTLGVEKVGGVIRRVENLTIESAIGYLNRGKADFYLYPKASIDYYLKNNPQPQIKSHPCCGDKTPMLLGFSKASVHLSLSRNNLDIGHASYDQVLERKSKAFALQQIIQQMKADGSIDKLYQKYYQ